LQTTQRLLPAKPGIMLKKTVSFFVSLLMLCQLQAQTDSSATADSLQQPRRIKKLVQSAFNRYFNDAGDPEKPKFLVYPTVAFTPETSWEIGLSALLLYYAKRDTLNRLSEIQAFNFITLNQQYGAWFDHFIYTDKDKWFFLGKLRFQRFPLLYYGIGPQAKKEDELLINSDYILIRERILRKIAPNFFGGLELDYQKLYNASVETGSSSLPAPPGSNGTTNFGLGAGLVYDTRHNVLNVRNGYFAEAAYIKYARSMGSDYAFESFSIDTRFFRTIKKNQVLAAQLYGQFIGGNVPFNQLALLGNESLMRGYYVGRYRDKKYIAAQAEYRFLPLPFSKRLGAAFFLSAGTVAPAVKAFSISHIQPAGGLGLRYLVFPKKDIFVRFDVGFTKEGPAFYIYTGEAF
jgi:hypothetical protein